MRPSAPSFVTFIISFILAALVIATYAGFKMPVVTKAIDGNLFEFLLVAYVLLLAGVIFRRM